MGFIPIFVTLGAFVFFFCMLVHKNLQAKQSRYAAIVSELQDLLGITANGGTLTSLAQLEGAYRNDPSALGSTVANVDALFREAKQVRHSHNTLLSKKPYAFVGRLFAHRPI